MHLLPILTLSLLPASTVPQQPEPFWHYAMMGSWIGQSEFAVIDVNGQPELFTGASTRVSGRNDYWYSLRRDGGTGEWRHSFVSTLNTAGIVRLRVGQLLPGSSETLALLLYDGTVELWDPAGKSRLQTLTTVAVRPNSMDLADLNGDGYDELFIVGENRLWIYEATGAFVRSVTTGGADVVVSQMDADPQLEIALASGVVLDGGSFNAQFNFNGAFATELEAGDVDGDGMNELIVMSLQNFVYAYDVDLGATKWALPHQAGESIRLIDVESDGVLELLSGQGQADGVRCHDALTASFRWSIFGAEDGVPDVVAVDVDGNGDKEIIWSSGAITTAEDSLLVTDWQTNTHQWRSEHLDGPFIGPAIGDLDGDMILELVVASSESSSHYKNGRILVFDSQSLLLKGISQEVASGHAKHGINDLVLFDLNGDGRDEVLIATDDYSDGLIEAYSFSAGIFSLVWTNPLPAPIGAPFFNLEVADVDRDGELEVVGGIGRIITGPGIDEQLFYVYDLSTASEEWRSFELGSEGDQVAEIEVVDFDRDGVQEIYGLVSGGAVYVYDGVSKALRRKIPGQFTSLHALAAGPSAYLIVGDLDGWVSAFTSVGGSTVMIYRRQLAAEAVTGITPGPPGTAWIAAGDQLLLIDLASGVAQWQSEDYGPHFGRHVAHSAAGWTPFFSAGRYAIVGYR